MLKIILIIVISISSCSKDRALVIIEDPDLSESYDIDYDAKTPKFNAKVRDYSLLSTRADNTLNNDNVIYRRLFYKDVVHIYFYKEGIYPDTGKYYCQALYKTNKKGLLIPVYDEVKIPPGIYNIYAVTALNSPYDQIPDFVDSTGVSNYIYNDVDYLWSNINDVDLRDEPSPTIEFVMEHLCCKLQFDFVAAEGDSINEVISANITAGDHLECSWAMNTGIINPATDINDNLNLKIDSLTASGVMLPLETRENLTLQCAIVVNDIPVYDTIAIPPPYGRIFRANYKYEYKISVAENGFTIL